MFNRIRLFQKSSETETAKCTLEKSGCVIKLSVLGWRGAEARLVCAEECAIVFTASSAGRLRWVE